MRNSPLVYRPALFAIAFAALILSACGAPNPQGTVSAVPASRVLQPAGALKAELPGSATHHLYVTDTFINAIVRFPVVNGVPAQNADATISGFSQLRGVTIGTDGRLYAIDAGAQTLSIFAPAPDGNSKPLHILHIRHKYGLESAGVDRLQRVWVNWIHVCTTEGFSCGYSDVYSPLERGLHYLKTLNFGGGPGGPIIRSMSFDPSDRLIEELGSQGVSEFDDAFNGGSSYPLFCGAVDDFGDVWGSAHNEIVETDLGGIQPKTPAQIVVIPDYTKGKINNCPTFYTITSATIPLHAPRGIATNGRYVYVADGFHKDLNSGVVFVFDPAVSGKQTPIATLEGPGAGLHSPYGIAFGP